MTLVDLPPEILIHTLLRLPFTSVVICRGVNRYLQALISGSTELQYYVHLGISGLVDNPRCNLSVSERHSRLLARELRWEELKPDFDKIIDVPVTSQWKRTGWSGGIFSILNGDGVLREIHIPREAGRGVKWKEARSEQVLIGPGVHTHEHDLHVLATAQPRIVYTSTGRPQSIHEIRLQSSRLSTGEPHPAARRVISFETHEELFQPSAAVQCVGECLVLVLWDLLEGPFKPDDQVYVYAWKTGELKMRFSAPLGSYRRILVLTTDIFVLPNATTGELEYWKIPQRPLESTFTLPFFILSLPRLRPDKILHSIYCSGEPNPTSGVRGASKPFYTDPHHALVTFYVIIQSADLVQEIDFMFFVHRNSLLGCLDKFPTFISSDEWPESVPYDDWGPSICRWFSDSIDGHQIVCLATAFGWRFAPSTTSIAAPIILLNFSQIDVARVLAAEKHSPKVAPLGVDDRGGDRNEADEDAEGPDLSEDKGGQGLGPAGKDKEVSSQSHETSAPGISSDQPVEKTKEDDSPRVQAKAVIRALDPLDDSEKCFENTVYSSLPYTVRSSRDRYGFDRLFLGEECILGLRLDDEDRVKQVHVLHYG
ncbi:hypothetical protein P691DRAFT_763497 [Macrolepiota fuliginosa MF-IS2]|uniref:F-box domain-containing protein n=1 Tax=Macrolepiota fuliginosa MF-IS2 TaxID=1400762 RepID=A0A9P6BYK1_9AGAR|nr:hypothetical protein P691DRAFT_763497 [Macrolepiota fuliginosa MF-IS2]